MSKKGNHFISLVLPCLNEEKTLQKVINDARTVFKIINCNHEIVVVDNGSIDNSARIAKKLKAKLIIEKQKGYGQALMSGIKHSKGNFLVIADADGTYDLSSIPAFIDKLQKGNDLVLGSRFKGDIKKGAMNPLRRYLGNPVLTSILNLFYNAKLSDSQTGFRAFTRSAYQKLRMKGKGMEFASEMIIKAIYHELKITEVPINYLVRKGTSKLSPVSDTLRHIKYLLLYSPTYTFIIPGLFLLGIGTLFSLLLIKEGRIILGWYFDIHTLTISVLASTLGLQLLLLGIFARTYSQDVLDLPAGPLAKFILNLLPSRRLFLLGLLLLSIGTSVILYISFSWIAGGLGELSKIREIIFFTGLTVIALQLLFSSLLLSLLKEEV